MTGIVQQLAQLPPAQQEALIASFGEAEIYDLVYSWEHWARPEQLTPPGAWNVWLILSGRGWGKTRTAAEDMKAYGLRHKQSRLAVIAPTYADARDTCIEGDSGLLNILPQHTILNWNRSLGELVLTNGTRYKLFSADQPERLRGPQHHRAWFDELCAARFAEETWTQMMFGLRLGTHPQVVVTTTPKRGHKFLKKLVGRPDVHVTRGDTFDNARNLAAETLASLRALYGDTAIGRQELYGELLEDVEGALWNSDLLEATRVSTHPDLTRIVVAIDPAVTAEEHSDETGIVVAGIDRDGHGYVLADRSLRGSPHTWAQVAVGEYLAWHADRIVAEVNNGGDMVEHVIRGVAKEMQVSVAYKQVRASRGKHLRAEPVSALYEQGRVHHVGLLPLLEDQMCSWEPLPGMPSPDRLDALVWALTELMVGHTAIGGVAVDLGHTIASPDTVGSPSFAAVEEEDLSLWQ